MIDDILTMIPGPTPVHERILRRLSLPTSSHQDPSFVRVFHDSLEDLKTIAYASSAQPFLVAGAGTLAMEIALVNLVGPGERLLVLSHGYFGDRWEQLAGAFGVEHRTIRSEWGRAVDPQDLRRHLDEGGWSAVAVTHVDTSTGTAAPLRAYADLLRGRDEIFIVDGVCATAGIEERFDDWGIDLLLTGAQKALGAPPGLAILLASERALRKRRSLSAVPAYYADLLRWLPIMEHPAAYFSTPPVNEIQAFHEALRIVLDEGLAERFDRHARLARAVRTGLAALGLELFTDPDCRADTLSVVLLPDGVDDAAFRSEMVRRNVVVAGALGPLAGRAFRLGHMGNVGESEILGVLHAIESSLIALGGDPAPTSAAAAAATELIGSR